MDIVKKGKIYMHKDHPELGIYLAEQALVMKYSDTQQKICERAELTDYCLQQLSSKTAKKLYLRLQKMEINRIIVDTVLNELPAIKKTFIEQKYKNNETFISISMKLNVSVAQLNIWNKSILNEIKNFMLYKLTEKDIFSRVKIINMLHIMDIRIDFFMTNEEAMELLNRRWLNGLILLREKYRKLLNELEDCIAKRYEDLGNNVISMKIFYPADNPTELAQRCHISVAAVSRQLKYFTNHAKKYLRCS